MESLEYLQKIGNALIANYDSDIIRLCLLHRNDINADIANLKSKKSALEAARQELSNLEKKLYEFESMRNIANALIHRPNECNIDSCYFIKEAIEANSKYPEAEYNKSKKKK